MLLTRRSVLYALGSLPVAAATPGIARSLAPAGKPNACGATHAGSLYVLFEGPWLFAAAPNGRMQVATFGQAGFDANDNTHQCAVQIWNGASVGQLAKSSQTNTVHVHGCKPGKPYQGTIAEAMNSADIRNPFVAVKSSDVTLQGTDRAISLPVPTKLLVGGRLINASMADPAKVLDSKTTPAAPIQPYVTTILRYDPVHPGSTSNGLTLTLTLASMPDVVLKPGQHLVFKMLHLQQSGTDSDHVTMAFDELMQRTSLAANQRPTISTLKDVTCDQSWLPDCLQPDELGIGTFTPAAVAQANKPPTGFQPRSTTYANCAGGGIIIGGGGGHG